MSTQETWLPSTAYLVRAVVIPTIFAGYTWRCTAPASYTNLFVTVSGHTQAESDAKVATAWTTLFTAGGSGAIYFNGPGSNESYVQDIYNNDVRTEGMSYGMIISVQLNHQTEFDRLWTWDKTHMASGTGEGCTPPATSPAKCAMSTRYSAPTLSAICRMRAKSMMRG